MGTNPIGEASVRIRPDTTGFEAGVRTGVSGAFRTAAKVAGGALIAGGLARTVADQIGQAGRLQKSLRESVGLLGLTGQAGERAFQGFSREVAALSREVGIAQQEIAGGLYEALGAGVPRRNAIEFLRTASRAATAGVTELDIAVDGLTTVMNAYGPAAGTAEEISDSLFQTVNAGKVTFDELASSLFNVVPLASSSGVSLQEVGAALATLTANGVPARVATTQISQAIQSIVAPSKEAERLLGPVFEEAGYQSGQAALRALGFQKTLDLIKDAAGGNQLQLTRMLGRVEALNAVLTLTGKGAGLFTQELENQADAAGVTDKALAQIERSAGRSFERAGNAARNFGLAFGDAAAPGIARIADGLESGLNDLSARPGFRQAVGGLSNAIADALLDPQTIATLQTFGQTAVDVIGAVGQAAQATAPAVQFLASSFGSLAASDLGPSLLVAYAAFSGLNRIVPAAAGRVGVFRQAQQAAAAAATAQRTAVLQSISAIGLAGPSSARAAGAVTAAGGRFAALATAARGAGAGLLAFSGGPVTLAVAATAALAGGIFLLSQRQSYAERTTANFTAALQTQAGAAQANATALERVKDATSSLAQGRVGIDTARQGVDTARADEQRIRQAPASDFGGEAQQQDAIAAAVNRRRAAELGLRDAIRQNVESARQAAQTNREKVAAEQANAQSIVDTIRNSGAAGRAGAVVRNVTAANRQETIQYAQALRVGVREQLEASRSSQALAREITSQARSTDTSTVAGRRAVGQLRQQAEAARANAQVTRARGLAEARAAEQTEQAIVRSSSATAQEKNQARQRLATVRELAGQLQKEGRKAGEAIGRGVADGQRSKRGEQERAGREGAQASAQAAGATSGEANAAGQGVGVALGQGIGAGVLSQSGFVQGAARQIIADAEAAARDQAQSRSPSRVFIRVGRDLAAGIPIGVISQRGKVEAAAAETITAALRGATNVTTNLARTQGGFAAKALADGFRVNAPTIKTTITTAVSGALRDSILTAQQNLTGFASSVADFAGRAVEALRPDFSARRTALSDRTAALDAAAAVDEERRLRNAVALADAGGDRARQRFASLQASIARRTPEQDARLTTLQRERERQRLEEARLAAEDPARQARLDLERFLAGQDEQRLAAEERAAQEATAAQRTQLDRQLADLAANLNARRISFQQFNEALPGILAGNGVNIAAAGNTLGVAFTDGFNAAIAQLTGQGRAVGRAPRLPAGFVPGIEDPARAAIAEAVQTRNVFRTSLQTELGRVRASQERERQALEATFRRESSAGGQRVVESEQRQLRARAAQHAEQVKEIKALGRVFITNPPQQTVNFVINPPPGTDPAVTADAVARRLGRAARR